MNKVWVLMAFILSGCTSIGQYAEQAHAQAQAAADATMELGRIGWCDAPTLGAMRRWYGADLSGFRQHLESCGWDAEHIKAVTQ